jgi:hypothetical protein
VAIKAALRAVPEPLAYLLVTLVQAYAAAGIVFAALFATRGVDRLDPRAVGAGRGFRLLIVPGSALWWPWLAWRWRRARRGRTP